MNHLEDHPPPPPPPPTDGDLSNLVAYTAQAVHRLEVAQRDTAHDVVDLKRAVWGRSGRRSLPERVLRLEVMLGLAAGSSGLTGLGIWLYRAIL